MTIDTLFLCFCEDCEINDGIDKPYFMSKGLMVSGILKALERAYWLLPQTTQVWGPFSERIGYYPKQHSFEGPLASIL